MSALLLVLALQAAAQEPPPKAVDPLQDAVPVRDRWWIPFPEYPLNEPGMFADPYRQNVLKGDYPILGQNLFMVLTGRSDTTVETRRLPVPSGVSTANKASPEFFGSGEQVFVSQDLAATFELYRGETSFRPRDFEIRVTGVHNFNYVDVRENALVNPDVRDETDRDDHHIALQEALAEFHLVDVSANYDFVAVRAGIQPFVSDFRGFLFSDTNLGARLFGTLDSNRVQWNLAVFEQLEKDTNSDLNTLEDREQRIWVANLYVQDFLVLGYTAQVSVHASRDDGGVEYDDNDFLVRPALAGAVREHDVDATYFGWTGDGHLGRVNITHAFYVATGYDEFNQIAGHDVDILAQMAAVELSYDIDWARVRTSFFWSSGDDDPSDDDATGFDTIFDAPAFAGGPFSFWNRQAVRLQGVNLVNRNSLVPDLRNSKTQGQLNFVNPGLFLGTLGLDVDLTTKLKAVVNASLMRFQHTEVLELYTFQPDIDPEIGFELGGGLVCRPLLNNNVILTFGGSAFLPGDGFTDLYEHDDTLYSAFIQLSLVY